MTLIAIAHPERWWLAVRKDVPLLSDPDLDDGHTRHRDATAPAWSSIAGVVQKVGRMIIAGDYAVHADDPVWVHVQVHLDGLDERDQKIVTQWFRGGVTSPSADPGDEMPNDGRHRLWASWTAFPQAVLPIYSNVLPHLDSVDLETDDLATTIISEAERVLANSAPAVLERSPAYADEIRRIATYGAAWPSDGTGDGPQDYLDQATVRIEFREYLDLPVLETWTIQVDPGGVSDLKTWLPREMRELAASDHGGCCGAGAYEMRSLSVDFEWGASASSFELVTTLRDSLMNEATWALLCALAGRLSLKLEPLIHTPIEPLDQDGLVHAARTTAVLDEGLDSGSLRVAKCTLESEHAGSVTLEDTTTGNTYTVETVAYRNSVKISRVKSWTYAS